MMSLSDKMAGSASQATSETIPAPARDSGPGADGSIDPANPFVTAITFGDEHEEPLGHWQSGFWSHVGTHYEEVSTDALKADLYRWLHRKNSLEGLPIKPNRNLVEQVADALKAVTHVRGVKEAPAWLGGDADRPNPTELLAFKNGLLHWPTRSVLQHTAAYFGLNAVEYDYLSDAPPATLWLTFLHDIFGDDTESIETLQEIFGLSLTGDTRFQKLFLLIGPRRSGKGTIARVLTALVGMSNVTAPTFAGLGGPFGLESLIGKLLAIVSDARLGGRADVAAITENLLRITGEDTVSVQRKHRVDWTARLRVLFLIISNELPALLDQSGALAGRFIVLRLNRSFYGSEDLGLTDRLLGELPSILLWALEGLDRLRARGHFIQPEAAAETLRQLETLASPIKSFVEERCIVKAGAEVRVVDLFRAWEQWCTLHGRERAGTSATFGKSLSAAYHWIKVTQSPRDEEKRRHRQYEGIRLRTLKDDQAEAVGDPNP